LRLVPNLNAIVGVSKANSASYPQRDREMITSQKCDDAVRLGSKGRYGSFHLWIDVGGR